MYQVHISTPSPLNTSIAPKFCLACKNLGLSKTASLTFTEAM